jgi:hypothetical protein
MDVRQSMRFDKAWSNKSVAKDMYSGYSERRGRLEAVLTIYEIRFSRKIEDAHDNRSIIWTAVL